MTSATDEELITFDRNVASVQKAASASLCLVATGTIVYTAIYELWSFTPLLLVGLALAVQSYRVAQENATAIEM